jgi:hypothetical protein
MKPPTDPCEETPLPGGNQTAGIVRVGDTVLRPDQPWSPAIRVLLEHLASAAPGLAPQPLGSDEQGRQVETFIEGAVGHHPLNASMRADDALIAAARLLRRYHDATIDLVDRGDLPWRYRHPDPTRHEVICHSDVASYNTVFRNGLPIALIDFDHAGPGPRLNDVAYAIYRFAPLASDESCRSFGWPAPPDRIHRARLFLDAYGPLAACGLIETAEQRIRDLHDDILQRAMTDPAQVATQLRDDHAGSYQSDLAWIGANREALARALQDDTGAQR